MKRLRILLGVVAALSLSVPSAFGVMAIGSLVTDEVGNGTATLTHDITLTLSSDVSAADAIMVGIYAGAEALPLNGNLVEPSAGPPLLTPSLTENMAISGFFIGQEPGEMTDNMFILSFSWSEGSFNSGDTVTVQAGEYDLLFNGTANLNRTLTDTAIVFQTYSSSPSSYTPMPGTVTVVPEPSEWGMLTGLTALGLLALNRRRW